MKSAAPPWHEGGVDGVERHGVWRIEVDQVAMTIKHTVGITAVAELSPVSWTLPLLFLFNNCLSADDLIEFGLGSPSVIQPPPPHCLLLPPLHLVSTFLVNLAATWRWTQKFSSHSELNSAPFPFGDHGPSPFLGPCPASPAAAGRTVQAG